jgi:hypothetical protein
MGNKVDSNITIHDLIFKKRLFVHVREEGTCQRSRNVILSN